MPGFGGKIQKPSQTPVGIGDLYEIALGLLLVVSSLFFYFRPHEYVLGGTDAGTYVNMSATIAKTGGLLPQGDWYKFLRDYGSIACDRSRLRCPGPANSISVGTADNENPKQLVPQFLPFHPALLAIGFSLFGIYGALYIPPLWGLLAVAAVYFFGRKLVSPALGLLSAFLFAITPVQVYFSRYPTTELLTLLLVFTGLLAFLYLYDDERTPAGWGVIGGASFGAALLTRIDLPLLIGLTLTALLVLRIRGPWSKGWTAFSLAFSLFFGHFLIQAALFSKGYAFGSYTAGFNLIIKPLILNPTILISVASILLLLFVGWKKYPILLNKIFSPKIFRLGLLLTAAGLSLFAYFIRPLIEPIIYAVNWPSGVTFPVMNGLNWVRMGWYLTPLGLALATTGFMLIVFRESLTRWGFFLLLGTLTTIQYTYNIMIPPYHIYAMRRYMPIVIPSLIIFSAFALHHFFNLKVRPGKRLLGMTLLLLMVGGLAHQSKPLFWGSDFPGMTDQLSTLNKDLKKDGLVIIAESADNIFGDKVGPPLQFIFGHDVVTIRESGPGFISFLTALQKKAGSENKPVQLLAGAPLLPAVGNQLSLKPVKIFSLQLKSLESNFWAFPRSYEKTTYPIEIYDVESLRPAALKFFDDHMIDIGGFDSPFIRNGFYGKETVQGYPTMRWTKEEALLELPMDLGKDVEISLRAMASYPPDVPIGEVTVFLDNRRIGRFTPTRAWQVFSFSARSTPKNGLSSIKLTTSTFNPLKWKMSNDGRDLGFLLDWVKII